MARVTYSLPEGLISTLHRHPISDYILAMAGGCRGQFLATKIKMKEEVVDCFGKKILKRTPYWDRYKHEFIVI